MSAPSKEHADELYRDKIRAARRMFPAERLAASGDLFDEVCERMRVGIRAQFPDADDEAVERILRERLEIARRLERSQ